MLSSSLITVKWQLLYSLFHPRLFPFSNARVNQPLSYDYTLTWFVETVGRILTPAWSHIWVSDVVGTNGGALSKKHTIVRLTRGRGLLYPSLSCGYWNPNLKYNSNFQYPNLTLTLSINAPGSRTGRETQTATMCVSFQRRRVGLRHNANPFLTRKFALIYIYALRQRRLPHSRLQWRFPRRLDRCDRMIQNKSTRDPFGGNV